MSYLDALDDFAENYNHAEAIAQKKTYEEKAEIPSGVNIKLSVQAIERLKKGFPAKLRAGDGTEYVIMPFNKYEILTEVAREYSLHLATEGKNIHGIPQLTPEERYGR